MKFELLWRYLMRYLKQYANNITYCLIAVADFILVILCRYEADAYDVFSVACSLIATIAKIWAVYIVLGGF